MSLLPNLLFLAASLPFQAPSKPAAPAVPQGPGAEPVALVHGTDPDYNALLMRYEAAIQEYDDFRIKNARKATKAPDPPHPARRFLAEFAELARKDSGGAQGRTVALLRKAIDDPAERVRLAREFVPMLAERHASEDSVLLALEGLKAIYEDFEEPEILAMAQTFVDRSPVDDIKAAALMLEAHVRSRADTTTDPERLKDKEELHRSVLYGFPKTRQGKEVSGYVYGPVQKAFYEAERKWVDELMRLQAAGKPPGEWPPQPIHDFPELFRPISAAGHHSASQFVNKLYPAYEQAARQSLGFGYQWLVTELGTYFSDGAAGPWNTLRADLITVLYRQFPTEKWIYASLKRVAGGIEVLPVERVEPGLQAILEKNQDERVVAWSTFCLAQCAKMRGDQKGYERAIELFAKVRAEYPDSEVSMSAELGRNDLARVMPGSPAPSVDIADEGGQTFNVGSYKGRALLLDIWTLRIPGFAETVPEKAALLKELEAKPFSIVGANFDSLSREEFAVKAKELGVTWRTALVNSTDEFIQRWEVRAYPTTILIDKKGIIRARNLPWPEMTALAKQLADE